nr:nucleotidyltransferase domain-containing protein [Candidatus Omnitrophota bacterium]
MIEITKSKTKIAILGLFFNEPEAEFYLRQLESITGYSVGNIRREMMKLEESGLFLSRTLGKMRLYRLNGSHPLYNEIKNIVRKTIGIEGKLKILIEKHKAVKFAFLYGSFAKGGEKGLSDIDIMIVGDIKPKDITRGLYKYQSEINREVNSVIYSPDEFLKKLKAGNHFINAVIKEPKIFLKGAEDEFRRFIQIRENTKA